MTSYYRSRFSLDHAWILYRNVVPPDRRLECFHTRVVLLYLSLTIYDNLSYLCKIIMLLRACLTTITPNQHLSTSYSDACSDWATFIIKTAHKIKKHFWRGILIHLACPRRQKVVTESLIFRLRMDIKLNKSFWCRNVNIVAISTKKIVTESLIFPLRMEHQIKGNFFRWAHWVRFKGESILNPNAAVFLGCVRF